jgi:tRNA(Arg) A34 adenosine deaminase TadA
LTAVRVERRVNGTKGAQVDLPELTIRLPGWLVEALAGDPPVLPTVEERMRLAIGLARRNVEERTGGPFGAAVFDGSGTLVAPGVNVVVASNCSVLHAEVVAIALAQKMLNRYDIGAGGASDYELVASTEPCSMCLGAVPWAGVTRVACGARDEDARRVGFDEGPKPEDWPAELAARGIEVVRDVLRDEAAAVLTEYVRMGGPIYNPGRPA